MPHGRLIGPPISPAHGQLVLYVDESGTHEMDKIDPAFPVLTLAGCAFNAVDYAVFENALHDFKARVLGDPSANIHSRDIRKWEGGFAHILRPADREHVATVQYKSPEPPYDLAVEFLIERFYRLWIGRITLVQFTSRHAGRRKIERSLPSMKECATAVLSLQAQRK
jgi:hypothetical protein